MAVCFHCENCGYEECSTGVDECPCCAWSPGDDLRPVEEDGCED